MNGAATGALRFWRHEAGDMLQGGIYIARGLKVVPETSWSDDAWKYVPRDDGAKTVERTYRTAIEDVSNVQDIGQYFR